MTEDITARIQSELDELERAENVKILHCVESGSRAWGFPSPDSDYDVRFIYIRPAEHYLKLENIRDVIEWQLDDEYDINGWDIQKALRLLNKSNPTLFEWNGSPIVYRTTEEWGRVRELIDRYFLSKHGIYHYLSTAKSNYYEYLNGGEVRLKKYFYVIRPILACRWIIDRRTPPPMLFTELAAAELEESVRPEVERLLELKMRTPELGKGKRVDALNYYIDRQLEELQEICRCMEEDRTPGWEELDELFLSLLKIN